MRLAIVDDDSRQCSVLKQFVQQFFDERKEYCDITCFSSGIDFVSDYTIPFDIILMDIDMPHMNGIDAAKKIREKDKYAVIIFITRMAQYAIQGYSVEALDFMVKPVTYFNLSVKLARAVNLSRSYRTFSVKSAGTLIVLNEDDILYVEGNYHYVIYHTTHGNYKVYSTLKEAEKQFGRGFSRCNNSFIVNLRYLRSVKSMTAVVGEDELVISRGRKNSFLEDVNRYYGGL